MNEATQRRLAAIVAADVEGYSRLMGADEAGTLDVLRRCRAELIDPLVADHGGRIVKTMGDGLLLEFPSVVNAVRCAIGMQNGMAGRDGAMRFRVGVHLGDVIVEDEDIFGDGVNVAARVETLAAPGGVAISDDAYRLVRDRMDAAWRDGGEHQVKNIARAIWIWRWSPDDAPGDAAGENPAPIPAAPAEPKGVAVLPFDNMSGDPEQAYFADGMTEDIITELSKIPDLHVISRNSTFAYRGRQIRAQDVCRDLGVRHVLEGSVRKAGNQVRVNAQLIEGATDGHVWAERYDRDLTDVFEVQDDLTRNIVRALELRLAPAAGRGRSGAIAPEAYDCFLRGREQYRLYTPAGYAAAAAMFEKAIALEPGYAAPHAALAETYVQDYFHGREPNLDRAAAFARKAAALDPDLALAHVALSQVYLFQKKHAAAIDASRRVMELEPGSPDGYALLAGIRHFTGEAAAVAPLIEKAISLNPLYPFYYTAYLGMAKVLTEDFEPALDLFRRCVARNPDSLAAHMFRAVCLGYLGRRDEAKAALAEARRVRPDFSSSWLRTYLPFQHEADLNRVIEGLARAGLRD